MKLTLCAYICGIILSTIMGWGVAEYCKEKNSPIPTNIDKGQLLQITKRAMYVNTSSSNAAYVRVVKEKI